MSWAHMARPPGGFANAYEHRELMKALVGYSGKSVDQVLAEQKQKHEPKASGSKGGAKAPAPASAPRKSELDKLAALIANAKPRQRPTTG